MRQGPAGRRTSPVAATASAAPQISVLLPTFDRAALVVGAVESALDQEYRDFELIVVDDGSTDGTEQALTRFADRIRFQRQEHRGAAAARNAGLRHARGAIVAFLDSDNLWQRDHLAVVASMLHERPEAVLASTCPGFITAGRAGPEESVVLDPLPRLLAANFVGSPSCIAVRREALEAVGGFDEQLRVADDADAWLRLALRGPFAFLRRRTVTLRRSVDSLLVHGGRQGHYLDDFERISRRMLEAVEAAGRHDLIDCARGSVHFAAALRALAEGDDATLSGELAAACRLFPELSAEPGLVAGRLRVNLPGSDRPRTRLRQLADAARAWPDQASDTAVALRLQAFAAALRAGRPATAVRIVGRTNRRAAASLLRRSLPLVRSSLRRRVSRRRVRP